MPESARPGQVQVGVIASAHGLRGQVKLRSLMTQPADIFTLPISDSKGRVYRLTAHGGHEALLIVSVDGVNDRNSAELLKGTLLFAPLSALPPPDETQWYAEELIGLEARTSDGIVYGRIIEVMNYGAGDILDIELAGGGSEMLPLREGFVGEINPQGGYVIVHPPEYAETGETPS